MKVKFSGTSLTISCAALTGVLLAFSTPLLAQKNFYKWKDASGTTHYSATPPPKVKASTVRISSDAGSPAQATSAPAVASSTGDDEALRLANEDYRKRACAAARGDVATARSGVMLVDGKDPSHSHSLTEEERTKAAAAAQARVNQFCPAGKSP